MINGGPGIGYDVWCMGYGEWPMVYAGMVHVFRIRVRVRVFVVT